MIYAHSGSSGKGKSIPKKPKKTPLSQKSRMRRFVLVRTDDVSGVSGTGEIAEGVLCSNGTALLSWLSHLHTSAVYPSIDVLETIHGHGGRTKVVFIDPVEEET